jgi:hypothetical protein
MMARMPNAQGLIANVFRVPTLSWLRLTTPQANTAAARRSMTIAIENSNGTIGTKHATEILNQ